MIVQDLVPFLSRVDHQQAPQSIEVQYPIEELQKLEEQKDKKQFVFGQKADDVISF